VFIAITFPLDEVLESSPEYAAIKDSFDFIMFLSIDQDWVWWWVALVVLGSDLWVQALI